MTRRAAGARRIGVGVAAGGSLSLAGCGGYTSIFASKGASSSAITSLGWFMTLMSVAVVIIVTGLLVYALFRKRAGPGEGEGAFMEGEGERPNDGGAEESWSARAFPSRFSSWPWCGLSGCSSSTPGDSRARS